MLETENTDALARAGGVGDPLLGGGCDKIDTLPPRSTVKVIGWLARMATTGMISLKSLMALPFTVRRMSPAWNPACSAALPGVTPVMRGVTWTSPNTPKKKANSRIARMKLAAGPAMVMIARCQTGLKWKNFFSDEAGLCSRILAFISARSSWSGMLAAFSSPAKRT
jgi:hypothetical protein